MSHVHAYTAGVFSSLPETPSRDSNTTTLKSLGRSRMKSLLLLAVQIALATAKTTEIQAQLSTAVGSAGVEVRQLNSLGDRAGSVFFDLTFPSRGQLAEWHFHAVAPGDFYADVWAVDYTNNIATLMGFNKLRADVIGFQTVEIPLLDRIHVEAGYAIGIHYDDDSGASVLSWEREPSTSGVKVSNFRLLDLYNADLHMGMQVSTAYPDGKASPALKAVIVGPNPNLRLVPEGEYRMGRVEIRVGDDWGTVCDRWFEVRGWPSLFCTELGFPGAEFADYTTSDYVGVPQDWTRYEVPRSEWASKPISMHSPRCKVSDNREFMACDLHPKGQCTHELDMYVECMPRMRCAHNRTRTRDRKKHTIWTTSCVPEIYQEGSWGYVGDTRPIGDFKNNNMTWLAAFCKEIGYSNVKRVDYALDQLKPFKPHVPVTFCNPTCSVPEPTRIGQCSPGPLAEGCRDPAKVFYITCERKLPTGYERPKRFRLTPEERRVRRKARREGATEEELAELTLQLRAQHMKNNEERERKEQEDRERREREQKMREEGVEEEEEEWEMEEELKEEKEMQEWEEREAEREEREWEEREREVREERENEEREQKEWEETARRQRERREREERDREERERLTDEERRAIRKARRQAGREPEEEPFNAEDKLM